MTKKRVFIVTAIGTNALLLVLPCAVLLWVWYEAARSSDPFALLWLVVINVMAIPILLLGGFNLLCVRSAWRLRGEKRANAIESGLTSCVALAFAGLVLTAVICNPIPMLVLCAIAYATAATLRQARAESKKGFFCPKCDYDLLGLTGTVCPECGTQMRPEPDT